MLTHLVTFKITVVQIVRLCHRQQAFAIYIVCMSHTVCVCHRQYVSVTGNLCLWHTVSVCHRQSVSITDSMCLSQTVCVCRRKSGSVTDSLFLSQTVFVRHKQLLSVTENLWLSECMWLSQTVCVCHRIVLSFSLSLYKTLFLIILCLNLLIYTWFSSRVVREILVCLGFPNQRNQLCGPLEAGAPSLQNLKYFNLYLDSLHSSWLKLGCALPRHQIWLTVCTVQIWAGRKCFTGRQWHR